MSDSTERGELTPSRASSVRYFHQSLVPSRGQRASRENKSNTSSKKLTTTLASSSNDDDLRRSQSDKVVCKIAAKVGWAWTGMQL